MKTAKFIKEEDIFYFQNQLIKWYSVNGRTFPWRRKSVTNYEIIIAEIFLQRTKAETVSKYLSGFLKIYPSWKQLSNATEIELREILKPLGLYNQRGNRLYKLAQAMKVRNGRFPVSKNEVEEMPMMGQYITNAYELYILKKKSPLLDVNMARLLERFFRERTLKDIRNDPYLQTLAYRVVNNTESKKLNWAILDFASLICRTKPLCNKCIFVDRCNFYNNVQTP